MPLSTDRLTPRNSPLSAEVCFLTALALFLATVEAAIPKPLPFLRLGLANLPLLLALSRLPVRDFFLLALLKAFSSALFSGTLFTYLFLFSLGGTLISSLFMLLLFRLAGRWLSLPAISMAGALSHTVVQLWIASLLLFGADVRTLFLPLALASMITGWLLGAAASGIKLNLSQFEPKQPERRRSEAWVKGKARRFQPGIPAALALILLFLLMPGWEGRLAALFMILLANLLRTGSWRSLLFSLITFSSILVFHLFFPSGRVLVQWAGLAVCEQSLENGLTRGALFAGMIQLSKWVTLSGLVPLHHTGAVGEVLIRFRRLAGEPAESLRMLYPQQSPPLWVRLLSDRLERNPRQTSSSPRTIPLPYSLFLLVLYMVIFTLDWLII